MIVALEYYERHEVEALAEAMALDPHRKQSKIAVSDDELAVRAEEDACDADLFRVLLHAGLRIGELRAAKWSTVDFDGWTLEVVQSGLERSMESRRLPGVAVTHDRAGCLDDHASAIQDSLHRLSGLIARVVITDAAAGIAAEAFPPPT
ncbi:MAG: hypothetical protein H0V22_01635 [Solirubrobacterales bacterium]|nr:hypothetical protein [Solirubrobacterales bacterium]